MTPRALAALALAATLLGPAAGFARGDEPRVAEAEAEARDAHEEPEGPPGRLDPLFRAINPSRLQRALDGRLGLDAGERSRRPEAPEIGEPVFFDNVRPLGDLKYGNEFNYLFNSSTNNAPTLQVLEYEYVIADWNAVELDLSYFNGNLQLLTPFYQRTLGVGRRGNWVHGVQLSPDIYLRSGFVGGSAVYMYGWKPEAESRFSSLFFVGENRALIGGFGTPTLGPILPGRVLGDRTFGAWRPTFNANFFYKVSDKFSLGIEDDFFFQRGAAAEYLVLPFFRYDAGPHAFYQLGGGYYRFENRDQLTLFFHINLVNDSPRKPREKKERTPEVGEAPGPIRRCLDRLLGDR